MNRNTLHVSSSLSSWVLESYFGDSLLSFHPKSKCYLFSGLTAVIVASLATGTPLLMSAFDVRKMSDDFLKIEKSPPHTRMGGVFSVHFVL